MDKQEELNAAMEKFLNHKWPEFLANDFAHIQKYVTRLQVDVKWLKWLSGGILLAIIATFLSVILRY